MSTSRKHHLPAAATGGRSVMEGVVEPLKGQEKGASSPVRAIWLVAALVVIVLYFGLVVVLAPDAPFMDDLGIADSVYRARAAASPWADLWAQHNEHRPVIAKLVFLAQRAATGSFDYTTLALIGNLFLVPVFVILALRARSGAGQAAGAAILFVAAMTFSYTSADSMLWAMAAVSNYGVIAFALLAFWMLGTRSAAWSAAAVIPALCAAASQGNGLLVLLMGSVFLLHDRRWISGVLWLAVSIGFIAAYLANYVPYAGGSNPLETLGRPLEVVLFALVFSGSALGYPTESESLRLGMMIACGGLGFVLWALVLRKIIASRFRSSDPLVWFSLFLIASGFLAALSRLDTGMIQALTPRYHVNSCLLIVANVLMFATGDDGPRLGAFARRAMPAFAVLALAYLAVSTLTLWRMHTFYREQTSVSHAGPSPQNRL